jgi:ferredoxin-NADP reductase
MQVEAAMPKWATRLIKRTEAAEGTMAFVFERPAGFNFRAGQFMLVSLSNPPYTDAKGNRRTFSIASPPQETNHLEIAVRMTGSALKRSLAEMELGTPLELLGPSGSFVLPKESPVPTVFIAGGVGITPFRSMVLDLVSAGMPQQTTLIYSNRSPRAAAFHEEFLRIADTNPDFKYLPTMTQAEKSPQPWEGERRHVDAQFLLDHFGNLASLRFFVAGPPRLVAGVGQALISAGSDPALVHSEEFEGY